MQPIYHIGGFHYGVSYRDKGSHKRRIQLFETLKEAVKEAKYALHNYEEVYVFDVQQSTFTAKVLYQSSVKRTLKELKEG